MTIEQVKQFYNAKPFQPFQMHMADGRHVKVASREFLAAAPSGRTVVVYDPDDSFHVIDLLLVTGLKVSAQTNGGGKRRHA